MTDLIMRGDPQFPNYDREYARKARGYLNYWREHNYMNPFGEDSDLGAGELLAAFAVYYDWCHDYLTDDQRTIFAHAIYHLMTVVQAHAINGGWYEDNHVGFAYVAGRPSTTRPHPRVI